MAKSTNDKYTNAASAYDEAQSNYSGVKGYQKGVNAAKKEGVEIADTATASGQNASRTQNQIANEEAKKYAGEQARATAAGTQAQATTAARAAGMNKAQAAMMGAQQNANAYQNAYGNAYGQQMSQANNNIQSNIANYGNSMGQQQNAMNSMSAAKISAKGTAMGAGQQEGQNEYNRTWGNWSAGLGMLTSDEKLKHYKECSKKVVIKSPNSIKKLKFVKEN